MLRAYPHTDTCPDALDGPFPKGFSLPLHILVVSSETPSQEDERRAYSGQASHESYADALRRLRPDITLDTASCLTHSENLTQSKFTRYDGIVFAGSPIQMHKDTGETRLAAAFMCHVFDAGVPSFGSCAGLQIAATAAGGRTGPRKPGAEVAFARDITRTVDGASHPLLSGRPQTWTAPAMHSSVVTGLPPHTRILASNPDTPVEVAEIRCGPGRFWGVQYHPELSLGEIAGSLCHQADDVVGQGLAQSREDVEDFAQLLQTLDANPERADLAWRFGLNDEVTLFDRRMVEVENFLNAIQRGQLR